MLVANHELEREAPRQVRIQGAHQLTTRDRKDGAGRIEEQAKDVSIPWGFPIRLPFLRLFFTASPPVFPLPCPILMRSVMGLTLQAPIVKALMVGYLAIHLVMVLCIF